MSQGSTQGDTPETPIESEGQQQPPPATVDDSGYKKTIQALRNERDQLAATIEKNQEELAAFKKQFEGIDPQKFAEFKQQVEEAEEQRQKTVEEQAQIINSEKQRAEQLNQEVANLKKQLEQERRIAIVRQAFFDAGGKRSGSDSSNAAFVDFILPHALQRIERDEAGNFVVLQKGTRLIDYDAPTGKAKDLAMLMTEFASDPVLGAAFEPRSQASGGGFVPGIRGQNTGLSVEEKMKMTPSERARFGREMKKRGGGS
ncbi:MAG: hypothetical protein F6K21_03330 [Symploca sp. SIO2D2]|nr:hypothetical protein [Symploca sp. SIO2D2]NER22898.1 hypothetical protein [Symploca sp. SIO1C2]